MNLRCDDTFVQDEGRYAAANRYDDFISCNKDLQRFILKIFAGFNVPVIIKYLFRQTTAENS